MNLALFREGEAAARIVIYILGRQKERLGHEALL